MPFPASEVEMTLVRDWVRKGISRPKFSTVNGFFCWIDITMLVRLLRGLPRLTALTMAASMASTSVAESFCKVAGCTVADLLEALFDVLFPELLLALVCCADRLLKACPSRTNSTEKISFFFMDEWFFHPEHSQRGGDISLRRHYPDQVGGYNLSARLEAPRMMRQR